MLINGGAGRDRTDDLLLAKQALSQLSYGPALAWPSDQLKTAETPGMTGPSRTTGSCRSQSPPPKGGWVMKDGGSGRT